MNALANSQIGELDKYISLGYPDRKGPVTFARYTGQESDDERLAIMANPPDILVTNYVMMELILTRPMEKKLTSAAEDLRFLVFDELHTYRGRQGADVALLARRVRVACGGPELQLVGTSATMASGGSFAEQQVEVARVATLLFGSLVASEQVIGETLRRATAPLDLADSTTTAALRDRVHLADRQLPTDSAAFVADPLASWIESMFGLAEEPGSGRLVRARPRTIAGPDGAAGELAGALPDG